MSPVGPQADITWARRGVRFRGESGRDADWLSLPSLTQTKHNGLFDHLVGACEDRGRDREAIRLLAAPLERLRR